MSENLSSAAVVIGALMVKLSVQITEHKHTVRPPRRFYEFRTRVMREIAGKGLKFTENPCETHARAMRNPCEVSCDSRSSQKSANSRGDFYNFHA